MKEVRNSKDIERYVAEWSMKPEADPAPGGSSIPAPAKTDEGVMEKYGCLVVGEGGSMNEVALLTSSGLVFRFLIGEEGVASVGDAGISTIRYGEVFDVLSEMAEGSLLSVRAKCRRNGHVSDMIRRILDKRHGKGDR
jgi:hypothetical protein